MGFLGDAFKKVKNTVLKPVNATIGLPIGATFDLIRLATPLDSDSGPDWLSTKGALGDAADLLVHDNTLTGWTISKAGEGLNWAYVNGVDNPLGAASYKWDSLTNQGPEMSWSEAWDAAQNTTLSQYGQMQNAEFYEDLGGEGSFWGKALQNADKVGNAVTGIGEARALFATAAEINGEGNDETKAALNPFSTGIGRAEVVGDPTDKDAWAKFTEQSPFFTGSTASISDTAIQFMADPFLIAAKLTAPARALRNTRPILEGEEVGLAEKMATEKTHKVLGLPSSKAGLQSRTDPLIGTVKYEEHIVDGKAVTDADGVKQLLAVPDHPGWLDGKSPVQVYVGLGLKNHAYGDQIASLLSRTNEIKDVGARVNIRRDILASMGGDAQATKRLAQQSEAREFSNTLSNMYQGKGSGELIAAVADEANGASIAARKASPALTDPDVVAGIADELKAQEGFLDWTYAQMKDRTLVVSAKGNRALARLAGAGLGRDGSLHTGYTGLDDIVNSRILGTSKSNGSLVDNALDSSDELVPGELVRDAKIYEPDQVPFSRGPNSQPAFLSKAGMRVAQWATYARPAAKVSDALRGRVIQGALNVEDAPLSVAVTQEFLRHAGVAPEDLDRLTSAVVAATGPTERAIAVRQAENHAVNTVAKRYGVDLDTMAKIQAEHSARRDAAMTALKGQTYSAGTKVNDAGEVIRADVVYLPDGSGTIVLPIVDTQTVNNLPLLDLDHIEKWLRRDKVVKAAGAMVNNFGRNPQVQRATEMGLNSKVNALLESNTRKWVNYLGEETNSWWKRGVLLTRAPSYAIRNTVEEMMRVASIGHTAVTVAGARRQGVHRAEDHARLRGDVRYRDLAPQYETLERRKAELEDLLDLRDDPEILTHVKTSRAELRRLRGQHTRAIKSGDTELARDLKYAIEWEESAGYIAEHGDWANDVDALQKQIAGLEKSLEEHILPDSGTHMVNGIEMPQAYEGIGGRQAYDRVAGGGTYDQDVTDFAERNFGRRRGTPSDDPIIDVSHPTVSDEKVGRHLQAWSWILNRQIRQDPAAKIALEGMAERADDIQARVQNFLDSPAAAKYRSNNPHRARDTEEWAGDISDMVILHAHDSGLAQRLLDGDVTTAELKELFPEVPSRPAVHAAGVDGVMGVGNRKLANFTGRMFQRIDKMSVNALTRHPLFSAFFQEEQERLARDFMRRAQVERGESATISAGEINSLTERARATAASKVRETFYDTTSKSSAAQKLRFMYPFFAAHQDSMTFWGRAIAQNPAVLRNLQLTFQIPASLGLVTDREGNPVKPGEFIQSDHMLWLQVPKAWGGGDLTDPTQRRSALALPMASFNLVTQNGSIINPGAGPMAAIPAGYVQKKWGSKNDSVSKMLTWFNPFGAPKGGDSPFLPGVASALDPALPTPVRRLGVLWDAWMDEKKTSEYTDMWAVRFQEAQVEFALKYDRQPSRTEAADMEARVTDEVQHMAGLRFMSSMASPVQPQPQSRFTGYLEEYRRLQEQQRIEGRGTHWASDTFLDRYGEAYMALTKSTSENRAGLYNYSSAEVRSLDAHSKLVGRVDPSTWRLIVGEEGEGPFSMDAYRWMQDKSIKSVYGGGKLLDKKDVATHLFNVNAATGWREFTKAKNLLQAAATEAGFPSVEDSPQLLAMKKAVVAKIGQKYPDWYQEYSSPGANDYESTTLDSLRTIASDKKLLSDPVRADIRSLRSYIQARDGVVALLKQRAAAGGSATITAQSNSDVAFLFARFVAELSEGNTAFSDFAIDGIISRDPIYKRGLTLVEANGVG